MKITLPCPARFNNHSDIAACFGLHPGTSARRISREFAKRVNFDACLHFGSEPVMIRADEVWKIRVLKTTPRCRVELRRGRRGEWTSDAGDVPDDVLDFLQARDSRMGVIETERPWREWVDCRWLKGVGRRLRGRSGEVVAALRIPEVARESGRVREYVSIEPLCIECGHVPRPVRFDFPVEAREIFRVVDEFRKYAWSRVA